MPKRSAPPVVAHTEPSDDEDDVQEINVPLEVEEDEQPTPQPAKRAKGSTREPELAPSASPAGPSSTPNPKAPEHPKQPGSLTHLLAEYAKPTIARAIAMAVGNVCNQKQGLPLECLAPRLREPHDTLVFELERALEKSEPSSALIVGPSGSGKTLLANRVVDTLRSRFDGTGKRKKLVVLHLDGTIAVNRDIRVAVALLSQQLCAVRGLPFKMGMDHTDDLAFLQDCVVRMGAAGETVLFLVEGLEAYAPKHARQTLLYTLLNLTHLQSVGACILGVSTSANVADLFEKRVKSRFSHRQIILTDFERFSIAAGPATDPDAAERNHVAEARTTLRHMLIVPEACLRVIHEQVMGGCFAEEDLEAARNGWNASVSALLEKGNRAVDQALRLLVVDVASSRSLAVIAEGCVRREDGSNPGPPAAPTLDAASLVRAIDAARLRLIRFTEDQLDSVSVLGMFFLVALCRLVYDKRRDGVNLREIYQEYNTEFLALSAEGTPDRYGRDAFLVCMEEFLRTGLIEYADAPHRWASIPKEYRAVRMALERRSLKQLVLRHPRASEGLQRWLEGKALVTAGTDGTVILHARGRGAGRGER